MSSSFDDVIQCQVEQFNQQVEDAASFHKEMLKRLCAERIRADFEEVPNPPIRIRVIEPQPRRPAEIVSSVLQQAGKVGARGKRIVRWVFSISPRHQQVSTGPIDQHDVIEGEFVVISDDISATSKDKEEN
jgi:hypothetical protein